jgi:hypothetical protein
VTLNGISGAAKSCVRENEDLTRFSVGEDQED